MEEENTNTNVNTGTGNGSAGTDVQNQNTNQNNQTQTSFDDFLKVSKNQAEFDRRVQQALKTAQEKWKQKNDDEKTEAERLAQMNEKEKMQYELNKQKKINEENQKKLNARDLKDEAIKIATTKETAFDPEFLNLFDFENMSAEQLQEKAKAIKTIQDRIVKNTINEWSKEKSPYNPNQDGTSSDEAQLSQIFGNSK